MAKLKRKKKEGVMSLGGKIITVFFIALLIGGAYFLYTLFRPVEINSINIAGEWKLADGAKVTYYDFVPGAEEMSGTATVYGREPGTGVRRDVMEYDYVMFLNDNDVMELHLTAPRQEEIMIKITSLSNAQMGIIHNGSKMANMTKTNLF